MNTFGNLVEILNDPQIKTYFLGILESNLSSEAKYQKFVEFLQTDSQIRSMADQIQSSENEEPARVLSQLSQRLEIWNPQEILQQTATSIKRAIRRLKNSQHSDGGWGFKFRISDFWATAYTVLCLDSANKLETSVFDFDDDLPLAIDEMLNSGITWLEANPQDWSIDPMSSRSVYPVSLAIRCFYQIGEELFSPSFADAVARCKEKLVLSQNDDGGWDASIWSDNHVGPIRIWSEVGSTSAALRALAEAPDTSYQETVQKAITWLIRTQNENGSWNDGSCRDTTSFKLTGEPAINKTCDAIQGILIGKTFNISINPHEERMARAVEWLQREEKPIFDADMKIQGWDWGKGRDYERTCLTLETLLEMPNTSLVLLKTNAQWLMKNQYKEGDPHISDPNDIGKWDDEHTARVTLALTKYYETIAANPTFV